ncbi:UbiH/UbiF/VisC/COQ6 family ubiquinone biosynthesis hydroxylase [Gilvimarinus sp. F26214L]|uniref:UbiH/UbiF/VisC/COQ6 family ubiquinone biosynthesis hydroxylase n=1 Tax=Gilvimarinus sp. DZF01 TaxID=3461371 RepID=UPI004045BC52
MSAANEIYDVVIVGGGLVGASLACGILNSPVCRNLRIALIDAGPPPTLRTGDEFDPRVVALTRQSERFLSSFGAWAGIAKRRLCPYTRMVVWDGEGTASISFAARDYGEDNLGYIVENSVALKSLLDVLKGDERLTVIRGPRVTQLDDGFVHGVPHSVLVLDNGDTVRGTLVLAADGGNSKIRELLATPTREWDYGQDAIVTTVRTENSHGYTAWQRFMSSGPLAFLPLQTAEGDSHFSSIVWSADRDEAGELMGLSDEAFASRLGWAFEHRLGEIASVAKRYSFPLRQRHAVDYVVPGFALLGDAAHTIHPLAGQGVNLGLQDAQALLVELERALQRGLPLADHSILRRYARARKGANLSMMLAMEAFKRLFGSKAPALHVIRNLGMSQVDRIPPLKRLLAREAMGLNRELRPGKRV